MLSGEAKMRLRNVSADSDASPSPKRAARNTLCNGLVLVCLCLAACFLSVPLNGLSPSLSLVAADLGFDEKQRDLYLGGYIGVATMIGQMLGSLLSGVVTDAYPRPWLLIMALMVDATATGLFAFPFVTFNVMLALRVVVGGCQGIAVPIIFSLIGDFYGTDNRATVSAIVSSFLGGGMMLGQLFVGYCLPYLGWRQPFFILALASMVAALILFRYLPDPLKGGNEEALEAMLSKGIALPPMSVSTLMRSLMAPTALLLIVQTVPNTVPWGALSTHLHDLLATDAHLTLPQATSLIAIFGVGGAIGGVFGGMLGAKLYALNRSYLPLFMGCTLATSAVLLKSLLTLDLTQTAAIETAFPLLIVAGALAAVNGANVRVVFINLASPEARGASIALLNLVNCFGRGCGPGVAELWMEHRQLSRTEAIGDVLSLWLLAGFVLCLASFTIARDEDRLRQSMRRLADDSISTASGVQMQQLAGSLSSKGGASPHMEQEQAPLLREEQMQA
jgi:MFS family permease